MLTNQDTILRHPNNLSMFLHLQNRNKVGLKFLRFILPLKLNLRNLGIHFGTQTCYICRSKSLTLKVVRAGSSDQLIILSVNKLFTDAVNIG